MNKQKEENEKLQAKEYQKEIISKAIGTLWFINTCIYRRAKISTSS